MWRRDHVFVPSSARLDERLDLDESSPHSVIKPSLRTAHLLVLLRRHHAVSLHHPGAHRHLYSCLPPSANEAFESVQYIMTRVQFGWLIRSVHSWSANLMIFTAFAHMFSVLFLKAYRKPRELTWVHRHGAALSGHGIRLSGYLLPWNKLAFFATTVGTQMAGQVPVVGHAHDDLSPRRPTGDRSHADQILRIPCRRAARIGGGV